MNGHSLKLHFCTFEKSQVKHNNLDCHKFFGIFSIKVYMPKLDINKKKIACSKHSNFDSG
jgi:hypothetical protein